MVVQNFQKNCLGDLVFFHFDQMGFLNMRSQYICFFDEKETWGFPVFEKTDLRDVHLDSFFANLVYRHEKSF
jgi:hypothetical protein